MFGRKKKTKKPGFWTEVQELRDLTQLKLSQGHGRRAMHEALKEQLRAGATPSVDPEVAASLKKQGISGLAEVLSQVPAGQQIRMTAAEYTRLTGQK